MAELYNWGMAAANNDDASPNGFPELMIPSGLNNSAREVMAVMARYYEMSSGLISTTGAGNAYVVTYTGTVALVAGRTFSFRADRTNTGAVTLNINSTGVLSVVAGDGSALSADQIQAGQLYNVVYTGTEYKVQGFDFAESAASIKTLYESNADTNAYTDAEVTKLAGIETAATADQSAAEILALLLTVDGAGSGLDADLLDAQSSAFYRSASNINAGILAVLQGGTGVATKTGTGSVVLSASPTLSGTASFAIITASGDITANTSDIRLKQDRTDLNYVLDVMRTVRPFRYYNTEKAEQLSAGAIKTGVRQLGFAAQEIQTYWPEVVKSAPFDTDKNGKSISGQNYLTLQYEKLVPVLWQAVLDLDDKIERLRSDLTG